MTVDVRAQVIDDLVAESREVDALVADLPDEDWRRPTPAAGWTVAHQVAHLAWTDEAALLAIEDPDGFAQHLTRAAENPHGFVDRGAEEGAGVAPSALLERWRMSRTRLERRLRDVPEGSRISWYGPPMSPASMATARLMETWAHGLDVADALGVHRPPTARLRHIAHLGVRTRDFAYLVRDLPAPTEEVRVELTGPDGDQWAWGPQDATERVVGPALDFCLLVTQRRHRDDLDLHAEGTQAREWLAIAQAFAGPPGPGRPPADDATGATP